MKKYLLLYTLCLGCIVANGQITMGGSTVDWQKYSTQVDTIYEEYELSYPSTSYYAWRPGVIFGNGLWAEDPEEYYPEHGPEGTSGHGMSIGFEGFFNGFKNLTEVNKNLHPSVDISLAYDYGIQVYLYDYDNSHDPDLEVVYGPTLNFMIGLGPGATFRPKYLSSQLDQDDFTNGIMFDFAYILDLVLYNTFDSYYILPGFYRGDFYTEGVGLRLDGALHLGVRATDTFGAYVRFVNPLTTFLTPSYVHTIDFDGFDFFDEVFDENVEFSRMELGLIIGF